MHTTCTLRAHARAHTLTPRPAGYLPSVAAQMKPAAKAAFSEHGIRYIRRYYDERSTHPADRYDPLKTKPWQAMFAHVAAVTSGDNRTATRAAVSEESLRQGFTPSWDARDVLKLTHE